MQVPKTYFHIAVVWNFLIRILLPLDYLFLIWFAVNLLQLASSSTNFESYVDVFIPLYVAEACGGILIIMMAIFLVRTYHLENDGWVKDLFDYARALLPSLLLRFSSWSSLFAVWFFSFTWMVCISMFSILLPLKLDDDDGGGGGVDEDERYTWNQVFLPIWIAYATSAVVGIICAVRSMPENPHCMGEDVECVCCDETFLITILPVSVFGLIPMISIVLIQLKLTHSEFDISWVEALSPMFAVIPLFCVYFSFFCIYSIF